MDIAPSMAALVLPGLTPENALALIGEALTHRGYRPALSPLPDNYPREQDEWLAFATLPPPQEGLAIQVMEDIDAVFRVARWLAEQTAHLQFAAVRRYMGGSPTVKFYSGGRALWRDGDDPDHELLYDLPSTPPSEAQPQLWGGQEASAATAERLLERVPGPWKTLVSSDAPIGVSAWVQSQSPLG
ncbi:MAG: hypothetical protein VYE15_03150 [Myxococcota bacterium]|nr:hypothetical protein [Myxococcota bacterium]